MRKSKVRKSKVRKSKVRKSKRKNATFSKNDKIALGLLGVGSLIGIGLAVNKFLKTKPSNPDSGSGSESVKKFNGKFDKIILTNEEKKRSDELTKARNNKIKNNEYIPLQGLLMKGGKWSYANPGHYFPEYYNKNDKIDKTILNSGHDYTIMLLSQDNHEEERILRIPKNPVFPVELENYISESDHDRVENARRMINYSKFMSDKNLGAKVLGTYGNFMLMERYRPFDFTIEISISMCLPNPDKTKNYVQKAIETIEKQYEFGYVSRDNKPDNFVIDEKNDNVLAIDFDDCFKIGDTIKYNNVDVIIDNEILKKFFISQLLQFLLTLSYTYFKPINDKGPNFNGFEDIPIVLGPIFCKLEKYDVYLDNISEFTKKNGLHHIEYYTEYLDNKVLNNIKPFEQIYQLRKYVKC